MGNNKKIRTVISILIGIVIFIGWFKFVNFRIKLNDFLDIKYEMLLGWLFAYTIAFVSKSLRWKIFLSPIKNINLFQIWKIYMAGIYINYVSPIKFGDIFQGVFLKKTDKIPVASSLPTIVVDRVFSMVTALLILTLIPFISFKIHPYVKYALLFGGAIFFLSLITLLFMIKNRMKIIGFLKLLIFWIPNKYKDRVINFFLSFLNGFDNLKKEEISITVQFILSFIIIISDAVAFTFLVNAMNLPLQFRDCLIGISIINLFYLIPTPPAGIGTTEWFYSIVFVFGFGVDKNIFSYTILLSHILVAVYVFFTGIIALSMLGVELTSFNLLSKEVENERI